MIIFKSSNKFLEAIEFAMAASIIDDDVALLFCQQTIKFLIKNSGINNSKLTGLQFYDIKKYYVIENELLEQNIKPETFNLDVKIISDDHADKLTTQHDFIFRF